MLHRLDPTNAKALYRKAQVFELLGKNDEAMEVIEHYFNINAGSPDNNFDKVFKTLKQNVIKKQEQDKIKSKELAQKMVN